jgi:hypothetical protein
MRHIFLFLLSLLFIHTAFAGASADPFVTAINSAWVAKDDAALATLIEKSQKEQPDNLTVLVAAYNYYLLFQPDLNKVTEAANQIKAISDKTADNPSLKAFSDKAQAKLPTLTAESLKLVDDKKREAIHKVFPKEFPGLALGIILQGSVKK